MRFCPNCERVMERRLDAGSIKFHCTVCSHQILGDISDARIAGETFGGEKAADIYDDIVRNAVHDHTVQLTRRPCKCGLPYMGQVIVGAGMRVHHVCKCGNIEHGGAPAPAAPPTDERKSSHAGR